MGCMSSVELPPPTTHAAAVPVSISAPIKQPPHQPYSSEGRPLKPLKHWESWYLNPNDASGHILHLRMGQEYDVRISALRSTVGRPLYVWRSAFVTSIVGHYVLVQSSDTTTVNEWINVQTEHARFAVKGFMTGTQHFSGISAVSGGGSSPNAGAVIAKATLNNSSGAVVNDGGRSSSAWSSTVLPPAISFAASSSPSSSSTLPLAKVYEPIDDLRWQRSHSQKTTTAGYTTTTHTHTTITTHHTHHTTHTRPAFSPPNPMAATVMMETKGAGGSGTVTIGSEDDGEDSVLCCDICLEPFDSHPDAARTPRILTKCSHTLCSTCIAVLISMYGLQLTCPQCRRVSTASPSHPPFSANYRILTSLVVAESKRTASYAASVASTAAAACASVPASVSVKTSPPQPWKPSHPHHTPPAAAASTVTILPAPALAPAATAVRVAMMGSEL